MQALALKRNRLEVLAEILQNCKTPLLKTRIMQKVNLSYGSLQDCLSQLQELGFIQTGCDMTKFVTTEKGAIFLGKWLQLQDLLNPAERVIIKRKIGPEKRRDPLF
jgi:predicted transcriptional regulator